MSARVYLRVSTEDQNLGIDAQRQAIQAYCNQRGLVILDTYIDHGISGATLPLERPGLSRLLGDLRPGETLLAAKRDRLARDDLAIALLGRAVAKARATLATADGSSDNALLAGILDVFAKHERQVISQRTKAALAAKRSRGEVTGTRPFGTTDEERAMLDAATRLRGTGASWRGIASELTRLGFRTRSGRRFGHSHVRYHVERATGVRA